MLAYHPGVVSGSELECRYTFAQMAALGMFMATTQMSSKERSNAQAQAKMRQAAKGCLICLEQLLQTDAERVMPRSQGFEIQ